MIRVILIFFILNFYNVAFSSIKNEIIYKLELTENLTFNFVQAINEKEEKGSCTIEYPKKIYCEYSNINKKILVSNGRSLVIKNRNSGITYFYTLKNTPLEQLLDKTYLISKIRISELRIIENKYLNFTILENDIKFNIFFDKNSLNLIGWQTEDIYQNLNITFISSVKINKKINKNIFILPKDD